MPPPPPHAPRSHGLRSHGLRFAFGTLSVLPVKVSRWDREAARGGMLCAPLVGVVLGCGAACVALVLLFLGAGPLLAAVVAAAVPAVLTRGLHLDGLADTADGLGSGKPAEDALRIMKQSDIGPFGVITLVFVLFAQVAALSQLYGASWARGALATVVSAVAARLALTLAARAGVPAARPEGLGAAVAGVVPVRGAVAVTLAVTGVAAAAGALLGAYGMTYDVAYDVVRTALAVLAALAAAELLLRHCTRRFGGVTGDVFGGLAETAATTALVVLSLGN
ncbi:adenosylcobinamide-GDP ribazoletransferase [Streptomyces sp. DT2A-34]|uniref:adenosylcobinamide-GDP ribazoletransferase n=1 Tax=Streptomyces sp. DT2A-34 TaxID=3051182 RepID=UPI00265BB567|nr:adenosylcobinamide-GDP ribazoletransferase [Streptomyces sp. DT2A-34]MDO0915547.1 adenosylcobinamide-GDP ribazoletransferase [Streptomyces sp. DT2A-34]